MQIERTTKLGFIPLGKQTLPHGTEITLDSSTPRKDGWKGVFPHTKFVLTLGTHANLVNLNKPTGEEIKVFLGEEVSKLKVRKGLLFYTFSTKP